MKSSRHDVLRYSSAKVKMEATRFNQVRLGLLRLGSPLRFRLPGLRHLCIVLEEDSWVCVDESLNDIPVLAWANFSTAGRDNLHQPLACDFTTYHVHAMMIHDRVLQSISAILNQKLHA